MSGQRKRVNNSAGHIIVNQNVRDDYLPPTAKRHRLSNGCGSNSSSKITKKMSSMSSASSTTSSCSGSSSPTKQRHFSIDDIDSNEKRNLHNDMERQRRIGLKNLFEALKKQIPSIKDKERAPKVNILREAAKLCDQLTSEERDILRQKHLLKEEIRQRQDRLRRLKSMSSR
uniref:BHLH domain-containing protein n=1 Tax=Megaselia scalaris TaxID=36166 RepID=T1GNE0_MEGSC